MQEISNKKKVFYFFLGLLPILALLFSTMYQSYAIYSDYKLVNFIEAEVIEFGRDFVYTGEAQEYIVPYSGYYKIELWGASGGGSSSLLPSGSSGAYTSGITYLDANEILYFYVGEKGGYSPNKIGGWNGGVYDISLNYSYGYNGGGATDVRLLNGEWSNTNGLLSRIMVAGGGGAFASTAGEAIPGNGGDLIGLNGTKHDPSKTEDTAGKGGTQTAGGMNGDFNNNWPGATAGTFGKGGSGSLQYSGNGGGGYYGGGGAGVHASNYGSAGGGSSFISGYAGVNAIENNTTITHTNNTLHYSGKYFINGTMEAGVNTGNGKAKITYLGTSERTKTNTKLDNVRYINFCSTGNNFSENIHGVHIVEFQAISSGTNVAYNKSITGTMPESPSWPYSRIIDGIIDTDTYGSTLDNTTPGEKCFNVDLGNVYNLDEIVIWYYYGMDYNYLNKSMKVSSDNSNWIIIDENDNSPETSAGKRYTAWD